MNRLSAVAAGDRRKNLTHNICPIWTNVYRVVLLLVAISAVGCGSSNDDPNAELTRELLTMQTQVQSNLAEERQRLDQRQSASDDRNRDLDARSRSLDDRRDAIDEELRSIADRRHRDPIIAASIVQASTLLAATLPALVLVLLLRIALRSGGEAVEAPPIELLAMRSFADEPIRLLPAIDPGDRTKRLSETPRNHPPDAIEAGPPDGKPDASDKQPDTT